MKLMADVALVGMPSVGKSSIIARISAARPKIADYPFTTLVPNLGVARAASGQSFVAADVPGLIEGASEGRGLGHQFLRHIERTALILHVVDVTGDAVEDYHAINAELSAYAAELAERPQIVVANKCDLPGVDDQVERLRAAAEADGRAFFSVSAATGAGLDALVSACAADVARLRAAAAESGPAPDLSERWELERQRRDRQIRVSREERHAWRVTGSQVERMVVQTDWDNDEAVAYLQHRFSRCGLDDALAKAGAVSGDEVRILELAFTFEGADDAPDFDEITDEDDEVLPGEGEA